MSSRKVILVTGVSGYWGAQVAGRLLEDPLCRGNDDRTFGEEDVNLHVIGYDANPPKEEIKDLDFIQADIRNPLFIDLLKSEQVHTVCHLAFMETRRPNENAFDYNVIGTMKVLGACAEAGVRKVVLMSSTAVYGAQPTNPAFLTEEHPLHGSKSSGWIRDLVEIESFCNGFRRQVPEMIQTTLRFANIIGPGVDTPMTRFLGEPFSPTLMGFDPLMQVIHVNDVVEAIAHAVHEDMPGVYNVAAEGVMPLNRITGISGKLPLPVFHLFLYWGAGLLDGKKGHYLPLDLDYLRYSWVADLTKMRQELEFAPRYTAEEALREFAGLQRLRRYMPESAALAYDEERLRDTIERRRRSRERQVETLHRSDEE
jgi:UDP-glucose 4-epimerase